MALSNKSFKLFRKLSKKEKKDLKPFFVEIAEDLKFILEWYKENPDFLEKDLYDEEESVGDSESGGQSR